MGELIEMVTSWHTLLLVIVMFGFVPGFTLRLLVKIYPRDDPRRRELLAELYELPRIERPLWVAEQLETVLFEGLPHRAASLRNNRVLRRKTRRNRRFDKVRQQMSGHPEARILAEACPWAHQVRALDFAIAGLTKRRSRVVVIGPAGSGKTTLAHLITRELGKEDSKYLPVWLDARRWDPTTTSFHHLSAREIARRSDTSQASARELVTTHGCVVPILDGLDEMEPAKVQVALQTLEREWSGRPVLITTRLVVEPSASTELISFSIS